MPIWTYLGNQCHAPNPDGVTDLYSINVGTITGNCFLIVGYFQSDHVTELYTSIKLDGVDTINAVTHTEGYVHMGLATFALTASDSGTTKSLVFTWPSTMFAGSISYGIVGGGLSRTATGTDRFAFGPTSLTFFNGSSGNGTGTQSIPSGGIGIAVVAHNVGANAITWTGATEDDDFSATDGGYRQSMAHLTTDADPNATATAATFVGVMAAFGP
jgi:hypothetical protein